MHFVLSNQRQVYLEILGSLVPQALVELRVKGENEDLQGPDQWDLMDCRENQEFWVILVLKDYQVINQTDKLHQSSLFLHPQFSMNCIQSWQIRFKS